MILNVESRMEPPREQKTKKCFHKTRDVNLLFFIFVPIFAKENEHF